MTNDVSAQILLAFLNDAWNRSSTAANSLRETLINDQTDALADVRYGAIASVSKNSTNQSYKGYGPGSLTQVQIVEALGNLLAMYDQATGIIVAQFEASADFDYEAPDGFDYYTTVYGMLVKTFNALSSGVSTQIPDIRDLRRVINPPPESSVPVA